MTVIVVNSPGRLIPSFAVLHTKKFVSVGNTAKLEIIKGYVYSGAML